MRHTLFTIIAVSACLLWCSCGQRGQSVEGTSLPMEHAQLLTVTKADGYTVADIANPWNSGRVLHRYILIPKGTSPAGSLPEGTVIRTPIDRLIVYSSVHTSIIDMLGHTDRIVGVCEGEYITCRSVQQRLSEGKITDCGNSLSPNVEKIAQVGAHLIIASPFENSNYGTAEKLGIPILEAADYMELHPLGRAEWVKLFGLLLDCTDLADSLYGAAVDSYMGVRAKVARHLDSLGGDEHRPSLMVERRYGASWNVPGGASYMATMYRDAGAAYIFEDNTSVSNVNMSFESVLQECSQADIWVLKYWSQEPMSYSALQAEYGLYSQFDPFRKRRIYGCNTFNNSYYDDIVIRPGTILEDLAAVFHPDLYPDREPVYYFPLENR